MNNKEFEVAIIGGSYIGLSLALMLANAGLKIVLIEKNPLKITKNSKEPSRLLAIAKASMDTYKAYGLSGFFDMHTEPITHIRVLEPATRSYIDFDPMEVALPSFGVMMEEHNLLTQLYDKAITHPSIDIRYATTVNSIDVSSSTSVIEIEQEKINVKLVIGCDGKHSWIRRYFGVSVQKFDYHQCAVVFDVEHEIHHEGVAIEKFIPQGPFAILPKPGGFSSCVVWTCSNEHAKAILESDISLIRELIVDKFGKHLGDIKLSSAIKVFPLQLINAKRYFSDRMALVGDAAHTIHPIAGQGFNLGVRDAETLVRLIKEYKGIGLDIGSYTMLSEYNRQRKPDCDIMIEATHNINLLFSNNSSLIKGMRSFGLRAINHLPHIRRLIMKYAVGLA